LTALFCLSWCWLLQAYGEGVVLEWLRKAPPIIRMEEEVRSCVLFQQAIAVVKVALVAVA
jgi:hypothetical protein